MFTYLPLAGICLGCIKFSFVWELLHLQRVFLKVPNLDFSNLPTWISPPACCNCSCLCRAYCPRPGRDPPRNSWNIILQNIHNAQHTFDLQTSNAESTASEKVVCLKKISKVRVIYGRFVAASLPVAAAESSRRGKSPAKLCSRQPAGEIRPIYIGRNTKKS